MNARAHAGHGLVLCAIALAAACEPAKQAPPKPEPSVSVSAAVTTTPPPTTTTTEVASAAPTETTPTPSATSTSTTTPVASGSAKKDPKAPTVALKPASKHVTGKNFGIDLASPGCKATEECAMTIRLAAANDFHVNKEYPYKFIATPAAGVTFLGKADPNTFQRSSGDFAEQGEKAATMTVRFKPQSAGEAKVVGKYKLSVCSADQCQIEEAMLDLSIPVM